MSSESIRLHLPQRKTDQYKEGSHMLVSSQQHESCPVELVRRLIAAAEIKGGRPLSSFSHRAGQECTASRQYPTRP